MPLVRISPKPGVNAMQSQTQNADGWWATNLVRWQMGLLEKIGGWLRLIDTVCSGYIRALHAWQDLTNNKNLLIGTDAGPQLIINGTLYTLTLSTFSSADSSLVTFSATNGDNEVTVTLPADAAGNVTVGATVTLLMPLSVGGRILAVDSTFTVTTVGATSFTFDMPSNAILTETNVVALPLFTPIHTTQTATVTFKRHGLSPGGTFHIDQTTSFIDGSSVLNIPAGTDLDVLTVPNVNTFTFDTTPYGTSLSSSWTIYEGTQELDASTIIYGQVFTLQASTTMTVGINPLLQDWFLDNLGEVGLILYSESGLYAYQPPIASGATATLVGNVSPATAPQRNHGMLVAMPQAQVLLWGTEAIMGSGSVDPLLIRFSDAGTYDTWTATASNQAGSYRLSKGSVIVGAIQAPQTTLIFTDTDVWSMSYQGPPLVYGFTVMGSGCGLTAPSAVATVGRTTYWLGQNGFWMFGEGGVRPLACPVWDIIFRDLDKDSIALAFAAVNSGFNEIAFFYPSLEDEPTAPANLLAYSQLYSAANWIKVGASITNAFSSPDGGGDGSKIIEDTTTDTHGFSQLVFKEQTTTTYTFAVYAQKTSTRWLHLVVSNAANGVTLGSGVELHINPITGVIVQSHTTGTGWAITASGTSTDTYATGIAGNGWLRYYITFTTDNTGEMIVTVQNMKATTEETFYAGDGSSNVYIWGSMLSLGGLAGYEATTALTLNNPTRYVKYNVAENLWDYGRLSRTAWLDDSIFGTPLGADFDYRIQQHERGYDDDDEPMRDVFAETGYGTVSDGSTIMLVDQCQPDLKWFGNDGAVNLTLKAVKYPGGPQQQYGPYSITPTTQFFSTRVRSKQVAMRYDWAPLTGYSARVGATSFRVKPAGTRP